MSKSAESIVSEARARKQENVSRNRDYYILYGIYEGLYVDVSGRDAMDGRGRPILRDNRRTKSESQPLVANLLKAIVDDYVSLTGTLPDIKVPPPGTTQTDQDFADYIEKFHYGVWHASNMVIQLKQMGWFNSALGGCSAVVWPNFKKRHAEIRFVSPDRVYGTPDLIDPFAYSSCIIIDRYPAQTIRDYFPDAQVQRALNEMGARNADWSRTGMVERIRYFDKDEIVTLMAAEVSDVKSKKRAAGNGEDPGYEGVIEMGRAKHGLGRCLVEPFQNILLPGQVRGHSDIEQAVGLNQHINNLLSANEEYVKQEIIAPVVIEGPSKVPEDINLQNPMEIIPVEIGGKVYRLNPSIAGEQAMAMNLGRAQDLVEYVTGDPKVRTQGRLQSSIATGRAIEKAQGPVFGRIEYRNDLNAFRLQRINEMSVLLTEKMFPDDEIVMFGERRRRGGVFRHTLHGKDLQGYTFNQVLYSPSMHMGLEQRAVFVAQMRGAKPRPMMDERTAIELLAYSDHPDEVIKRIDAEMERDAQYQARLQGIAQGSDPMDAMKENVALNSGAMPKPAAVEAPAPEAAATIGAPMDMGALSPDNMMPTAESTFAGAPDLRAQVQRVLDAVSINGTAYIVEAAERIRVVVVPPSPNGIDGNKVRKALKAEFGDRVMVRESRTVPEMAKVAA